MTKDKQKQALDEKVARYTDLDASPSVVAGVMIVIELILVGLLIASPWLFSLQVSIILGSMSVLWCSLYTTMISTDGLAIGLLLEILQQMQIRQSEQP